MRYVKEEIESCVWVSITAQRKAREFHKHANRGGGCKALGIGVLM